MKLCKTCGGPNLNTNVTPHEDSIHDDCVSCTLNAYREHRAQHGYSEEEIFEIRTAFGPNADIVDFVTGKSINLKEGKMAKAKSPCSDVLCECRGKGPQAVKQEESGRWFITMGHAGFNSKANNGVGYASEKVARTRVNFYQGRAARLANQ